ncbi:MAG: hypothetical protein CL862_10055 [Cyanobium sp. NAT70]|nr:hypothetical protein [Cyanobium sp. NAT70]
MIPEMVCASEGETQDLHHTLLRTMRNASYQKLLTLINEHEKKGATKRKDPIKAITDFFVRPITAHDFIKYNQEDDSSAEQESVEEVDPNIVYGTEEDDRISVSSAEGAARTYYLLGGNDHFLGSPLISDHAPSTVYGGTGRDNLFGGDFDDYLDAGNDNDWDNLNGGAGHDTLVGYISSNMESGSSPDMLTGGSESDTFIVRHGAEDFDPITDQARDVTILDFCDIGDRIVFEGLRGELYLREGGVHQRDQALQLMEVFEGNHQLIATIFTNYNDIRGIDFMSGEEVNVAVSGNVVSVITPDAPGFNIVG